MFSLYFHVALGEMCSLHYGELLNIVSVPVDQQFIELLDHLDEGGHVDVLELLCHEYVGFLDGVKSKLWLRNTKGVFSVTRSDFMTIECQGISARV
jgi:hypothetical protein